MLPPGLLVWSIELQLVGIGIWKQIFKHQHASTIIVEKPQKAIKGRAGQGMKEGKT